jgi:DNA-binding response OmpR family regulator
VNAARARILLVEDHDNIRALLAEALEQEGYEVVECADAPSAIAWLDANAEISAVILDWILGGAPAEGVLRRVLSHPASPGCVLTSGYRLAPQTAVRKRVVLVGKPFTHQMIQKALEELGV